MGQNGSLAFVFSGGIYRILPNVNGTTTSEFAFGVKDKETIVGQYADSNTRTTFGLVYRSGAFTTLNPVVNALLTNAQGINNNGLVTGFYSTNGTHSHGFLFNTETASYTLIADPNVPTFVFSQLLGINDNDKGIVLATTAQPTPASTASCMTSPLVSTPSSMTQTRQLSTQFP